MYEVRETREARQALAALELAKQRAAAERALSRWRAQAYVPRSERLAQAHAALSERLAQVHRRLAVIRRFYVLRSTNPLVGGIIAEVLHLLTPTQLAAAVALGEAANAQGVGQRDVEAFDTGYSVSVMRRAVRDLAAMPEIGKILVPLVRRRQLLRVSVVFG